MINSMRFAPAKLLFLAVWGTALLCAARAASEEGALAGRNALLSRGRAAALMTALFYHNPPAAFSEPLFGSFDGTSFSSAAPGQALEARERAKVVDFAKSLVYEGGYYPQEIYTLLGYRNAEAARVARQLRQLDHAANSRPSPWEVAGRVGRSGMSGASDHWAMAPGGAGDSGVSSPGTLAYLPALAVVYADYPVDGLEASSQLAVLKDDDVRAGPAARAGFSLLRRILISQRHDKDEWLRAAALDSRDADTEHDLLSVRVKDMRYLRGEECAMGRLERAVHIWYRGDNYGRIMASGRETLRSRESLAYLSALSAATYGQEGLPSEVIVSASSDRQLLGLVNDLYDLATSEAVLRVASEENE